MIFDRKNDFLLFNTFLHQSHTSYFSSFFFIFTYFLAPTSIWSSKEATLETSSRKEALFFKYLHETSGISLTWLTIVEGAKENSACYYRKPHLGQSWKSINLEAVSARGLSNTTIYFFSLFFLPPSLSFSWARANSRMNREKSELTPG